VLPRYLCAEELSAGSIVALHEPDIPPINTLYLAARTGTATRPHIHTVRTHLLDALRTAP
jgi:DNA-binding transcriptional LysR family regulator